MNEQEKTALSREEMTSAEQEVIRMIRELDYGHIVLTVKAGKAVHAELQKSVLIPNS